MKDVNVEGILEILRKIGNEGDDIADWWNVISKIVRRYIMPYIENLDGKIDNSYLNKMIEEVDKFYIREGSYPLIRRVRYGLSHLFSWDIFKLIDILFRAADLEYRSLRGDDKLGENLVLIESESMANIYKYDFWYRIRKKQGIHVLVEIPEGQVGYLVLEAIPHIFAKENIEDILKFYKTMIIVGYQDKMDPQLENLLTSHGYRCIRRTVNDNIVILFAKTIKEEITTG